MATDEIRLTISDNTQDISLDASNGDPYYVGAEVDVERVSNGVKVTARDKRGTTTANVYDGVDGRDGVDGEDGVGIAGTTLNDDYTLTITYTDGTSDTTESIRGAQGEAGQDGQDGQDGADGFSPIASVSKSGDTATITITDKDGTTTATVSDGADGQDGSDGADGYSPSASVSKSGSTATITITDKNGTTTATVSDGADGQDGQDGSDGQDGADGFSPVVTVTDITGGHQVSIEDSAQTQTFDVMDGEVQADGYYDELYAGNLMSDQFESDNAPYLYRQTPHDAKREYLDSIVGATVAWNQLVPDQSTATTDNGINYTRATDSGTYVLTGTATSLANCYIRDFKVVKDHKYLYYGGKSSNVPLVATNVSVWGSTVNRFDTGAGRVLNALINGTFELTIQVLRGVTVSGEKVTPQFFDLTQMFGTAIADYIYSLELTTTGAGVEWFRKLFPKVYYAYDTGSLQSVNTSAHETVGKNKWPITLSYLKSRNPDGTWTDNVYYRNGVTFTVETDNDDYVTKVTVNGTASSGTPLYLSGDQSSFPKLIDGASYILSGCPPNGNTSRHCIGFNQYAFDTGNGLPFMWTTLSYTTYIWIASGYTANNLEFKPMIRLASVTDATFEPYVKHSYPLDSDLTLRGIPKLDSSNNLYYDGDVYEPSGEVGRKYKADNPTTVLDGGYNRQNGDYIGVLETDARPATDNVAIQNVVCNKVVSESPNGQYVSSASSITINSSGQVCLCISGITTKADLQQWVTNNPVSIVYELATPTTETADAYEQMQIVDGNGTEEFVTSASVPIPVGHNTRYMADLKAKLQDLPDVPSAPTTDGTYVLRATVSGGVAAYTWESIS